MSPKAHQYNGNLWGLEGKLGSFLQVFSIKKRRDYLKIERRKSSSYSLKCSQVIQNVPQALAVLVGFPLPGAASSPDDPAPGLAGQVI